MTPLSVVEDLNIFKDGLPGFCSRFKPVEEYQFVLNGAKKGLCGGIIVAIAFAAHAGKKAVFLKQFLKVLAGILGTSVGVMDQSSLGAMPLDGLFHGFDHEIPGHGALQGSPHDCLVKEVFDGCQVEPSFLVEM